MVQTNVASGGFSEDTGPHRQVECYVPQGNM